MTTNLWTMYPVTYRAREMKILAGWIAAGESGAVVGLSGCGRSNLLGFLGHRPEVLQDYLGPQTRPVALIQVDLYNLPVNNLSTLYRVILRAFYRVAAQFESPLQQKIITLYHENRTERDPFLPQSALQELLLLFQTQHVQVVLVFNRFDRFCQMASLQMVNTLRGLRDDFKDTLCYIAGMTQEAAYLSDPTILGDMYELLDNYVCWLGAMNNDDARNLITRATRAGVSPSGTDVTHMLALTGQYPALLRATCYWWLTNPKRPAHSEWPATLLAEHSIQRRLTKIWNGLTQEEQFILSELQKSQTITVAEMAQSGAGENKPKTSPGIFQEFAKQHFHTLTLLAEKGVCRQTETGWCMASDLLAGYVARIKGRGRGKIWLDKETGEIYQGQTLLEGLTTLEISVLSFLIKHPRIRHTKTDLIVSTWADELRQQGVTDNSLYQVILGLRKAIEPNPGKPVYLITWRGKPEGGYQFFPEGRPR